MSLGYLSQYLLPRAGLDNYAATNYPNGAYNYIS